jgi:hypothetical protein
MKKCLELLLVGCFFVNTTGCVVLETCDPDVDPSCIDETKAQIKGHISVAGAEITLEGVEKRLGLDLAEAHAVLSEAYASYGKQHNPSVVSLTHKSRLPTVSSANHIPTEKVAKERWRVGEIIFKGKTDVRYHRSWWIEHI